MTACDSSSSRLHARGEHYLGSWIAWRVVLLVFLFHLCGHTAHGAGAADDAGGGTTAAGPLGPCGDDDVIRQGCIWATKTAAAQPVTVASTWPSASGAPPVLFVRGQPLAVAAPPLAGFSLDLQRFVLANVTLSSPEAAGVPKLWPLGLYNAVASKLLMWDVRIVVGSGDFQRYLQYFSSAAGKNNFLAPENAVELMHTDGESFMHIPEWVDEHTVLHSVTLLTSPCTVESAASAAAMPSAGVGGCNVRTVDNTSLIPILTKDAAVSTRSPLLVLITANVSLGAGMRAGAVSIRRPTALVGLWSIVTSVDLGMTVNQLNVTDQYAIIYWQSLFLENAAPGDATSSLMAAPYSAAVSANIYAMLCNRSSTPCLNLHNTTTVLASQQEMDYTTFMYSMYNSPLPNMRQHTAFYLTELRCTVIDLGPGPNGYGMTLSNLSCSAWKIRNGVFTTTPVVRVAPQLPFPTWAPRIRQSTQAAPWVEGVHSCQSLQAALQATSEDRLYVWMLLNNVSIAPPDDPSCWKYTDVEYTTQIYGQVQEHSSKSASGSGALDVFALDLGFKLAAFQLPDAPADRFMQLQNVSLLQLPQGPGVQAAAGRTAGGAGSTPSDVWTLLLWSFNRTMTGSPVFISDVQLSVPQQEFDFVANTARGAASFVVPLDGTVGLAFTSVSLIGNRVFIQSLQGPGLSGSNVWLLADPAAAGAMPGGYVWPLSVSAAPSGAGPAGSSSYNAAVQAAIGASIGGAALLAILGVTWWRIRRRRQKRAACAAAAAAAYKQGANLQVGVAPGSDSDSAGQLRPSVAPYMGIQVEPLADAENSTDEDRMTPLGAAGGHVLGHSSASSGAQVLSLLHSAGGRSSAAQSSAQGSSSAGAGSSASDANVNTVASGLQRWKAAISTTTIQLMERRMQSLHSTPPESFNASTKTGPSAGSHVESGIELPPSAGNRASMASPSATATNSIPQPLPLPPPQSLQLQGILGQGSFGCVYLGIWHGKRVAVKVMQLPANALLDADEQNALLSVEEQQQRQRKKLQSNSPPHMAIMETVVSSTMSHPNVVQVYTYMLNPLTVGETNGENDEHGGIDARQARLRQQQQQQRLGVAQSNASVRGSVSGWELKLVMEYCDQGTLREALDHKILLRGNGTTYLQPSLVLSLAHDVAAALLHLHTEGVVHGDLKAANVLLTKGGEDTGGVWSATVGYRVTAKVADFGLALQLDPKDTHATMAARGTPTHMSPELFMSGHVSKASDVYAFGILLYEIMTGQRAYRGVPVPLLPHEVARQGLRPTWPPNLPAGCRDLRRLAEACWAQQPQDRPSMFVVFSFLESCQSGKSPPPLRNGQLQQQQQQLQGLGGHALQQQHQLPPRPQQHQQRQQDLVPVVGNNAGAPDVQAKGEMSWSEVTYDGMKRSVH